MRISLDQVNDYKGKFVYFTLANDKDEARVRILWETIADIDIRTIHEVRDKDGNYHKVDCLLQNYDDSKSLCPCCSSANDKDRKTKVTCMIPVYNLDKKEVQIWTRTGGFVQQALLPKLIEAGEPFCATVFTVQRNGAAGDQNTRYELINEGTDDFQLDDLEEEVPNPIGELILEKTFEELAEFQRTRSFEKGSTEEGVAPRNRTNADFDANVTRRRGTTQDNNEGYTPRRGARPEIK